MYSSPENLIIPKEVKNFQDDCEKLGVIYVSEKWYINEEWSAKFKYHLNQITKLAENGDPWAKYSLGIIYMCGYQYSSFEEHIKNYEEDIALASKWLEEAAKHGFVAAVDNLVVVGVGPESDRLRSIAREVETEHPEFIEKWKKDGKTLVITPSFFETVWKRAYGSKI